MVAFILAFTFRVYVLEAYIIPTGSMAPTLLGGHVEAVCEQCGYEIVTDASTLRERPASSLRCPMCFFSTPLEDAPGWPATVRAGDRILVQKYAGMLAEPRRFDVVVFKNPQNPFGSGQNFIKRLTGLPGERLLLLDGNVYVAEEPPADVAIERLRWRIARKTDEQANPRAQSVQRSVFRPVYHSRFSPADGGLEPDGFTRWDFPWQPDQGRWNLEENRFTPLAGESGSRGSLRSLRFDFSPLPGRPGYQRAGVVYPYNQLEYGPGELAVFEDFRLAVTLTPAATGSDPEAPDPAEPQPAQPAQPSPPADVELALEGVARLAGGPVAVRAHFGSHGARLETRPTDSSEPWVRLAASAEGISLPPPESAPRLEFWVVDQELSAWIDGERVARHRVDLNFEELFTRPAPPQPADQNLTVSIQSTTPSAFCLTDLDLDRDLFHDAGGPGQMRGGVYRDLSGRVRIDRAFPVRLAEDQFFLLGDNSPQSDDGRRWSGVDPWIRERYFADIPPSEALGRVPRELLIGRAFCVYYPAARPLVAGGAAVLPDLSRMRSIH